MAVLPQSAAVVGHCRYSAVMDESDLPSREALGDQMQALVKELQTLRGPGVDPALRQSRAHLKAWQCQRLARTHAALLGHPRYAPAARFFLDDLYGPKDHAQRDRDVERVLPKLLKLLPRRAVHTLVQALRMDALTESLDADLADRLVQAGRLRTAEDMDHQTYGLAYRECGRAEERALQIDLALEIGRSLDHLTRLPMLATTLKMMRLPAHKAGLGDLHDFLQRGFTAFAHMRGAEAFLEAIVQAERALMVSWLQPPTPTPPS